MKLFFPDSQDCVDPSFDFITETRSASRIRQRDDLYPHEIFRRPPFAGLLVSKGIVDGASGCSRYTLGQRRRLCFGGVREFFRLGNLPIETMGDCGAFAYVREERPPYSVEEVIRFYQDCGFDYGVSVDHIILEYESDKNRKLPGIGTSDKWCRRRELTLELAEEFYSLYKSEKCEFVPIGVAQGWNSSSYAQSVDALQKIGYRYIGLGGLVPLKTYHILEILTAVDAVRNVETQLHLFGVTRLQEIRTFSSFGVASFDSTSPLKQAFMDALDNYHTVSGTMYAAIRVPQVDGNSNLRALIRSGKVDQGEALKLEKACLRTLRGYDKGAISIGTVLDALRQYANLFDGGKKYDAEYNRMLTKMPWKTCPCEVCKQLGIDVVLFRGAERNRRRGFHNLYVLHERLTRELAKSKIETTLTALA